MITGIVRWFNNAKGYGFLGYEGGPDVFVHYSAIQCDGYKSLKEGMAVEFTIETGPSGRQQAASVVSVGSLNHPTSNKATERQSPRPSEEAQGL